MSFTQAYLKHAGFILAAAAVSAPALGHSVKQKAGTYADNQGRERQRLQMDLGGELPTSGKLTASSMTLSAGRDKYIFGEGDDSTPNRELYGENFREQNIFSLSAAQTWEKITDTRVAATFQSDDKVKARSFSAGASQWIFGETVRISYDLSRTVVEQPEFRFLDYDSKEVGNPPIVSSVGSTVAVRHLASTTTIMDYSASRIENENRPATNAGTVGLREFVPTLDAAVHVNVNRSYNRGYIGTDTTYGQVDAWSFETAWLQTLWQGASGRMSYRYYKEDETTRAYADEKIFGSDMYSVSFIQRLGKKSVDNVNVPLQLEAGAAKYLTNVGIAANSYEMGVTAKF
jgi:hypothetical protein